LVIWLLLMS